MTIIKNNYKIYVDNVIVNIKIISINKYNKQEIKFKYINNKM